MKRSDTPTNYIYLHAYTNSDWDYCQFVIIHLSTAYRASLQQRLEYLKQLPEDPYLSSICFWDSPEGFYYSNADEQPYDMLPAGQDWVYVDLDPAELSSLPVPTSTMEGCQLIIQPGGSAQYRANSKHTGEEFWTDSIDLTAVLSHT